jgi:uncharacterized protein YecE (DUF72 family)
MGKVMNAQPAIYIGTSGFAFDDWKGTVFPERLPRAQWLIYYEQQLGFNALEIKYTDFCAGLAPLCAAGKLGAVLLQFPCQFTKTPAHQQYLARAIDRLADLHPIGGISASELGGTRCLSRTACAWSGNLHRR